MKMLRLVCVCVLAAHIGWREGILLVQYDIATYLAVFLHTAALPAITASVMLKGFHSRGNRCPFLLGIACQWAFHDLGLESTGVTLQYC